MKEYKNLTDAEKAVLEERGKQYVEKDSCRCPICKSNEISAGRVQAEGLEAWANVDCQTCGAIWQEIFILANCSFEFGEIPDDWQEKIKWANEREKKEGENHVN